ncbi:MAG: phosphatase PAP2 family protein [Pseudomonadota bacterium]
MASIGAGKVGNIIEQTGQPMDHSLQRLRGLPRRVILAYLPLVVLWAIYYAGARLVLDSTDAPINYDLVNFLPSFLKSLPFFLIGVAFVVYFRLFVFRSAIMTPRQRIAAWFKDTPWIEFFLLRFVPTLVYIFGLQRVYVALKPEIPNIVPFSWDADFLVWDRVLLFGYDAWEVSHWLLPSAYGSSVIDELYTAWFYVLFACIFVAAMAPLQDRIRLTYLVSFALNWGIGGSLLAIIFSSAGPVYYERLFGDPVFAPLLDRLNAQHLEFELSSVIVIEKLWQGHLGKEDIPGLGISAFPSMHLALATANTCFAFKFGRWWGWAMVAFTAATLFGSVHLGWHYVVDGIAGIALGIVFWALSWRFTGWWLKGRTEIAG